MSSIFQTPELAIGIAVGGAAGAAFEPKIEVPKQKAWQANPVKLPDFGLIAALLAGGKVTPESALDMAERLGFDSATLDAVTWLSQDRLDFAVMLRLWRLFPEYVSPEGLSITDLVKETLAHEQLDWNYYDLLLQLQNAEKPGIGDIAYSVVRGYLPTNIKLPVAPPATNDYVPRFPQSGKLAETWAQEIGYDADALELFIARSGLSMAPVMAANALFRSDAAATINALPAVAGVSAFTGEPYVGPNDYKLAISEGDLRTEWADAVRETAREILTAGEYAELELRGYIDKTTRRALTAQHGMSDFDSDLKYDVLGRAVNVHGVTTGLARGGTYPGSYANVPSPFKEAIQRSNIREEYSELAYANRYGYPSGFMIRGVAQAGELTEEECEELLLEVGWSPKWAKFFATAWTGGTATAPADAHVKKAQSTLWTEAHKAYVKTGIDVAQVTPAFTALGIPADAQTEIVALWDVEKQLAADVPPTV